LRGRNGATRFGGSAGFFARFAALRFEITDFARRDFRDFALPGFPGRRDAIASSSFRKRGKLFKANLRGK
jgi:hypothetical protein